MFLLRWGAIASLSMVFGTSPVQAAITTPKVPESLSRAVLNMETRIKKEYDDYFGRDLADVTQDPVAIARSLDQISRATGKKTAVLWVIPRPHDLHLVLITPNQPPIVVDLEEARQEIFLPVAQSFQWAVSHPLKNIDYFTSSQQLYRWIIEPFEQTYLKPQGIEVLLFCLGSGVRTLPLAALHDGQQFLIEKYSLSRIPAFNLIDHDYRRLQRPRVLAMGASTFPGLTPLPAVPVELRALQHFLNAAAPTSRELFNQQFTLGNLEQTLRRQSFDIVHFATHAEFRPGAPSNSYIQLWDQRLTLSQMNRLNWRSPTLELLVLSACRTAVGDRNAELGFAGVALQAGVKSAVASLWYVDDVGTLALMSEFYRQLPRSTTKGEALRQAQIRLLRGEARADGDHLRLGDTQLPLPTTLQLNRSLDFRHPRYWSAFTLISSPW
ncbi:CHAT domain-containing protein [Parathermosynechococcus lividus]